MTSVASYEEYDNMTPTERKDALITYMDREKTVVEPFLKDMEKLMKELKEDLKPLIKDLSDVLKVLKVLSDELEEE